MFKKLKDHPKKKLIIIISAVVLAAVLTAAGILIYQFTKPCNHVFDNGTVIKEPLCNEIGSKVFTCQNCGYEEHTELPIIEHDFESKITEATCKEEGEKKLTCKVCALEKIEAIPVTDSHTFEFTVKSDSTCAEKGIKEEICTLCGTVGKSEEIELKEHTYSEAVTAYATCTAAGEKTITCSVCGDSKTEAIPANGHSWNSATCTAAKKCSSCGITEGSSLGHTAKIGKCDRCGTTLYGATMKSNQSFPMRISFHSVSETEITAPVFSYETVSETETKVYVQLTGTKIWNKNEELPADVLLFGFHIFDSNGEIVQMGYWSFNILHVGETETNKAEFILPNGEYEIKFYSGT